jgi:hypothetical protein
MSYNEFSGGGHFWGTEMNEHGFMGFVDKWWIFWHRIGTALSIICFILAIVTSFVAFVFGKETFNANRARHQNRQYS